MAKSATLTDIHELVLHIVEHMATKEDLAHGLAAVREEMATKEDLVHGLATVREEMATKTELSAGFASIRSEFSEVKERLGDVEEAVENLSGLTTEMDHLHDRTVVIERHVGLQTS